MLSREKVSLNAIAFDSTFRLIDQALLLGVNLEEVRIGAVWLPPAQRCEVMSLEHCSLHGMLPDGISARPAHLG